MRYLMVYTTAFVLACGADQTTTESEELLGGGAVTVWTDLTELFFEYPPLIAGVESEPWAVHVTDLRDFRAVTEGSLELRMTSTNGETHRVRVAEPSRPGVYGPVVNLPASGTYELIVAVQGPLTDEIFVGPIQVYSSVEGLPTTVPEDPSGIPLLKEQQWTIPFATVAAQVQSMHRSVSAPGEIIPAARALAQVPAPVAGLLIAARNQRAPVVGDRVRRGTPLGVIAPSDDEGSYATLVARVERLEREVARAERLYNAEAIPQKRLEETRHDLAVARAALEAFGGSTDEGYELVLRAPLDGVVTERSLVAGARVAAGDRLFTIVDPSTVWLRLHVSAVDATQLVSVVGASFTVEGSERVFRAERLVAIGDVIDPARRTVPVTFAVSNPDRALKIGALASGWIAVGDPEQGLAVPTQAVREEDGVPVVYVQTGGELFERRVLTLGPTDGRWTIVWGGVSQGERVVTMGAYQVRLAALNPDAVSDHGHPH